MLVDCVDLAVKIDRLMKFSLPVANINFLDIVIFLA
jgi:hypothetical protein